MDMSQLLDIVGQVSNFAGAIGGTVSAVGVVRLLLVERRKSQRVDVFMQLQGETQSVALPLELLRRDVSRAELLGRIGMLPMREKGKRFSLRFLSTPAFMGAVNDVVDGKTPSLVIPATAEELAQFDI